MCCCNGLLLLTILLYKSLRKRKEFLLIAGMATTDFVYGCGAFLVGVYRFLILFFGLQSEPLTPWQCVTQTPYFLFHTSAYLSSAMSFTISVDRFIAVARPLKYYSLDAKYAKKILLLLALFWLLSLIILWLSTYFYVGPVTPNTRLCALPHPQWYARYLYTFLALFGCLSVSIYAGVFFAYRRATRMVFPSDSEQEATEHFLILQRRLTVTLGIITVSTLFCSILPTIHYTIFIWLNRPIPYQFIIANLSRITPVVHVAIYVYRQREIRAGMWGVITLNINESTLLL